MGIVGAAPEAGWVGGWVAPMAVAVVVASIAGVGAWAGRVDHSVGAGPPVPRPAPTALPGRPSGPVPGAGAVCPAAVRTVVPDAHVRVSLPGLTLWSLGQHGVLCATDGGRVTVLRESTAAPLGQAVLALSAVTLGTSPDGAARRYVAGGLLPRDVRRIDYVFPDGTRTAAGVLSDADGRRWWLVDYAPTTGMMADPQVWLRDLAPAHVMVTKAGGAIRTFAPPWPDRAAEP